MKGNCRTVDARIHPLHLLFFWFFFFFPASHVGAVAIAWLASVPVREPYDRGATKVTKWDTH